MKMKLMLSVLTVCFLAASVSAGIELITTDDASIESANVDNNNGNGSFIKVGSATTGVWQKGYLKFDASAYAPSAITAVEDIDLFIRKNSNARSRACDLYLLTRTDGMDNNWVEGDGTTGITWANAPYNDVSTQSDQAGFNNYGSQGEAAPLRIGYFNTPSGAESYWADVVWGDIDLGGSTTAADAKAAVLAALTSADQKVTIGIAFRGTAGTETRIVQKDWTGLGDGLTGGDLTAARLTIVPEPATLVLLGLGSLTLLRKRK